MFYEDPVFWFHALRGALLAAAFLAFAWALRRSRRENRQEFALLAQRLDESLAETRRLATQVEALGGALDKLEARPVLTTVQKTAAPATGGNNRGYETAIRLARRGASVEEIVASSGTTRTEAKLLRRLHEYVEPRTTYVEGAKIA